MAETDLATLGIRIDATQVTPAATQLDKLTKAGNAAELAMKALAIAGVASVSAMLISIAKQAFDAATKFEYLGVTMRVAGNNAGYTAGQMREAEKAFKSASFNMIEAREMAKRLAIANIDLSKSSQLATLSQNLAAAASLTEAQAFESLSAAIVSGREIGLKQIGLNLDFATSYYQMAKSLGKTTETLTETEKASARLNAILALAPGVTGVYEASLNTVGGQLRELGDDWQDLLTKLGNDDGILRNAIIVIRDDINNIGYALDFVTNAANAAGAAIDRFFSGPKTAKDLPFANDDTQEIARVARGKAEKESIAATQLKIEADKVAVKVLKERTDQTNSFIESLQKEVAQAGLDAVAMHNVAAEMAAAKAPTDALKNTIRELEAAWAAATMAAELNKLAKQAQIDVTNELNQKLADQNKYAQDMLKNLEFEAGLIGKTAEQRARLVALHQLELQGIKEGTIAWELYARQIANAAGNNSLFQFSITQANAYLEILERVEQRTRQAAADMANSFGNVGKAIGDVTVAYASHASRQEAILTKVKADTDKFGKGSVEAQRSQSLGARELAQNEIKYQADVLSATKQAFGEKTALYKALQAAETVYRTVQLAMAIQAMVMDATETASSVANSATRAAADGSAAVAKTGASVPFPYNIAAMAAVAAALVSFGVSVFGGGGGVPVDNTAKDRQAAQGAGTVLGDLSAKSNSIEKSLDQSLKAQNEMLEYSSSMNSYLRSIDESIGSLSALLARQLSVGGIFNTSGKLGTTGSGGFDWIWGTSSKKTTTELQDQGLAIAATSIGRIIADGIVGSTYQSIRTITEKKKLFGIISSTSTNVSTSNGALPDDIQRQFTNVIAGLRSSVLDAAQEIGLKGAQAAIDSFVVNIGTISLKDMTGSEIQDTLNAVFSKLGDEISLAVLPSVSTLQQIGEGALETFVRLAREYKVVDVALSSIGLTFSTVGATSIEARDRLVQLSGGLEEFANDIGFFAKNFLSEAQQIAPIAKAVNVELSRLGVAAITNKDQFAALVGSLDLSTQFGASLFSSLMAVAPAFAEVADSVTELQKKQSEIEIAIMEETGDAAGALAAKRGIELEALDASLRPLQIRLNFLRDEKAALENLISSATNSIDKLISLSQSAASQARQAATAYQNAFTSIGETIAKLRGGSLVTNAKQAFERGLASANAGDVTALAKLPALATAFLDASKSSARSAADIARARAAVLTGLGSAQSVAAERAASQTSQADLLDNQIKLLEATKENLQQGVIDQTLLQMQIVELRAIGDNTASVADDLNKVFVALTTSQVPQSVAAEIAKIETSKAAQTAQVEAVAAEALKAAQAASQQAAQAQEAAAKATAKSNADNAADALRNALDLSVGKVRDTLTAWQRAVPGVGAIGSVSAGTSLSSIVAELQALRVTTTNPRNTQFLDKMISDAIAGVSAYETAKSAADAAMATAHSLGVPGYAAGGMHRGGWRRVGERGPEIEYTGPSQIFSNSQSRALVDNSELVRELQGMRKELGELKASAIKSEKANVLTKDILQRVSRGGDSVFTEAA